MGILDTLLGNTAADTANRAAQLTEQNQMAASKAATSYGAGLPSQYNAISEAYNPFVNAGTDALNTYRAGLGLSGPVSQAQFNAGYENLPGYQSALKTGLTTAERGLNAGGGGLNSGAALKALYRYGSDYNNQRVGDYLTRLQGLQGQGLAATGGQTGIQTAGLGAQNQFEGQGLGYQYGAAPTIGQGQVAGAQAQQQGIGNLLNVAGYLGGAALGGRGSLPSWGGQGAGGWGNLFMGGGSPSGYGRA